MPCYLFITGGVVSSLGKGLLSASLGLLLKSRGHRVSIKKLDPYLNVDPGTMNPYEHGEVYVTEDGGETDLDLGHYERFAGVKSSKEDNITSGKIYREILKCERNGFYLGKTIQVIPHFTDLVKKFLRNASEADVDFVLVEVGGTVGDIEGLPFLEGVRQFNQEMKDFHEVIFLHLTLVPYLKVSGELKTKPTQHSVRALCAAGITPHLLVCRSEEEISVDTLAKISECCNVKREDVLTAIDVKDPHLAPLELKKTGLDERVLFHSKVSSRGKEYKEGAEYFRSWKNAVHKIQSLQDSVRVSVVAKYAGNSDSYRSIIESLKYGGLAADRKVEIEWIDSERLEMGDENALRILKNSEGILIPGGFGYRGIEGKILAAQHARVNNIPFFGICFGMQMAVIEFARNVMGIKNANSAEFGMEDISPIITRMKSFQGGKGELRKISETEGMGGTMRLGSYRIKSTQGSKTLQAYGREIFEERHRHRYEFNPEYIKQFEDHGFIFSSSEEDKSIVEVAELESHLWYVGVQFHPEFSSNILNPHPLFFAFIDSIAKRSVRIAQVDRATAS